MPPYTDVACAPGGRAPPSRALLASLRARFGANADADASSYECTRADCGGPDACVHRWLGTDDDPFDLDVLGEWRDYDDAPPPSVEGVRLDEARGAVDHMLRLRVHPATLVRCGATTGVLSALGYTLESLVGVARYDIETLLDVLAPSERELRALAFRPHLWRDRSRFPLVAFTERAGVRASSLAPYAMRYSTLVAECALRQEELVLLGYNDAAVLRALGMTNVDVARACAELERPGRGARWYWRAFRWNRTLASSTALDASSNAYDESVRRGAAAFARVYADEMRTAIAVL